MVITQKIAVNVTELEDAARTVSRGPVAAFLTIKQSGTNDGAFIGSHATHPRENSTLLNNAIAMAAILARSTAYVWMFGRIVKRLRLASVSLAARRSSCC